MFADAKNVQDLYKKILSAQCVVVRCDVYDVMSGMMM